MPSGLAITQSFSPWHQVACFQFFTAIKNHFCGAVSQTQGLPGCFIVPVPPWPPSCHLSPAATSPSRSTSQTALNRHFTWVGEGGSHYSPYKQPGPGDTNSPLPPWKFLAKGMTPMTTEQTRASLGCGSLHGRAPPRTQVTVGQGRRKKGATHREGKCRGSGGKLWRVGKGLAAFRPGCRAGLL